MFQATKVSGTVPTAGVQSPVATAQSNQANVELIRSADVLSRVAESRPGGVVQGAELVDMANNSHGQYQPNIQRAARVFLVNNSGVYRAREAIRRRNSNPHSACAGGRAYDFHDLQSICDYMQQHQHDQQGQHEHGQYGGHRPFAQEMGAHMGGHAAHDLLAQMATAIQHLIAEMMNLQRRHMSLERLMSMGYRGNPGAQYLLTQPEMLVNLVNREAHRNLAITLDHLQRVGLGLDMQQNGAAMGNFYGDANFGFQSPAFAGGSGSAGFGRFGRSPDFIDLLDASVPNSPTPDFQGAADFRRQDELGQQQLARDVQQRQDERQRLIRQDAVRNMGLQAMQHRDDALAQQRRRADDVAADLRVTADIAAQQRHADDSKADQILADHIKADQMRVDRQ